MKQFGLIILAAGSSSRLGEPKQLLEYKNKSLVRHIVDIALQMEDVYPSIVIGSEKEKMEAELKESGIQVTINYDWEKGMSSSLVMGLKELLVISQETEINGCLFVVCDQPYITTELLNKMISTALSSEKGIVAASYAGTVGTPVFFTKSYFVELLHLKHQEGAKQLLEKYPNDLATVPFDRGEIDIDTQEDYQKLIQENG